MKINMHEFNGYLEGLGSGEPGALRRAVTGLAKYTGTEWEGTVDTIDTAVTALTNGCLRAKNLADGPGIRAEAAKVLGNIGTQSAAAVPELLRLLKDDSDTQVRTEAARALGKIGEGAVSARQTLASILSGNGNEQLRGEAARALARVDAENAATVTALKAATDDRSGHVGVCAAEALWSVARNNPQTVPALAARLTDPTARSAAVQALYRIGSDARGAVPALLTAAKQKDRLFHESVVMALRKIDPEAANKVAVH